MEDRQLLLLGLLLTQAQYGYQLNDFIEKNMANFVEMKRSTAYSTLDRLCETGHVQMEMEQVGNRPTRKTYSLTAKGKQRFDELLRKLLLDQSGFVMPIETALLSIDSLTRKEQMDFLCMRLDIVKKAIEQLATTPDHDFVVGVNMAISHRLCMLKADRDWLQAQLGSDTE